MEALVRVMVRKNRLTQARFASISISFDHSLQSTKIDYLQVIHSEVPRKVDK